MSPEKRKINHSRKIKILFTGGGSGGHIYPVIAVIRELEKIAPGTFKYYFIGPRSRFAKLALAQENTKFYPTVGGKIRRYFSFKNFIDILFRFPLSFFLSFFYVFFIGPDIVLSKGGYGAFPASLWSWFFQIPLLVHESDAEMGLTNRILARLATQIFVSFPHTKSSREGKHLLTGNPVREELLTPIDFQKAKEELGLDLSKPVLLVLGGSQGSQVINNIVLRSLASLLDDFIIIHQCGEKDFKTVKTLSKVMTNNDQQLESYVPYSFLEEWRLKRAYKISDLIISRAGAGTISEIAAFGKPSILIPLTKEVAGSHQIANAYRFSHNEERSVVIEEKNFTPSFFAETVNRLFQQPYALREMGKEARSFAKLGSGKKIAQYLIQYLNLSNKSSVNYD
jgi:UDP-N-acetylglucosamine--N-acetylmuramyl-(pentapeptide) pyrophosphoryl-undecaprenol N-acetylglucosamine transferase